MIFTNQIVARSTFFVNLYYDSYSTLISVIHIQKQRSAFLHLPFIPMDFSIFLFKPFRLFS